MTEQLKEILAHSRRIVFFGGAGVSTESGIPDFRSEDGLFRARRQFGLPPEELVSHDFFIDHPEKFYRYYSENLIYPHARPNAAHKALSKLEEAGKLTAVITQNIDGLHQLAGSKRVHELHGSVLRNYCMSCAARYTLEELLGGIKANRVPRCKKCGGVIRPDVVLYGESLDQQVLEDAVNAISAADTMLVGGTSLAVWPAAGLLRYFHGNKLIVINKSATPYDFQADLVIRDAIGKVLGDAVIWG